MNIKINENLKQLRNNKGITQEALADHLGVTPQAISRWESGAGYPAIDYLPDIAEYFECFTSLYCVPSVNSSQTKYCLPAP